MIVAAEARLINQDSGVNVNAAGAGKLNKLVRKAGSVVGASLDSLEVVAEQRRRLHAIMGNHTHPLNNELMGMRSTFSHRLVPPRQSTKRFGQSLVPTAIRLHNQAVPTDHRRQGRGI